MNAPLLPAGSTRLVIAMIATLVACRNVPRSHDTDPANSAGNAGNAFMIVVHDFRNGLAGAHARSPDVRLSLQPDPTRLGDSVLVVEYPPASADPAARDVQLEAAARNWTAGRALFLRIKPDSAIRLSVSFLDRNRVVYTSWIQLEPGRWRTVEIPFDRIRPNPYFQPPGARQGAPIDISEVTAVTFAPQSPGAGRLTVGRVYVVR